VIRQIKIVGLSMLAAVAISAVMSASASASGQCYKVVTAGTGRWEGPTCVEPAGSEEYDKVLKLETELKAGEWCAKGEKASEGRFEDNKCAKAKLEGEFAKVLVPSLSICREGGTEKYETHLCGKTGETGKWSFLPVEQAEKYALEGTGGVTKLEATLLGEKVIIACNKDKTTGEVESGGRAKGVVVVYEECKLYTIYKHVMAVSTACAVPNITTNKLNEFLVQGSDYGPEDEIEPAEGTTIAKVKIEGTSCALASNESVTGKQICSLPEATVGLVEHALGCSPGGGTLEFDKKPASYYGTTLVKLTNGAAWGTEP